MIARVSATGEGLQRGPQPLDQTDPVDPSTIRRLDDLERRAVDMEALLCSTPSSSALRSSSTSFIARGIQRVH
jgi:hypothetical protein